ncbi:hypothetical protein ACFQ4K_24400 [Tistrella bauzanensis]
MTTTVLTDELILCAAPPLIATSMRRDSPPSGWRRMSMPAASGFLAGRRGF